MHHDFGYLIIVNHDEPIETIAEYRTDSRMKPVESTGVSEGFNFTKGFAGCGCSFILIINPKPIFGISASRHRPAEIVTPSPLPSVRTGPW